MPHGSFLFSSFFGKASTKPAVSGVTKDSRGHLTDHLLTSDCCCRLKNTYAGVFAQELTALILNCAAASVASVMIALLPL